jgi:hypothetical protein
MLGLGPGFQPPARLQPGNIRQFDRRQENVGRIQCDGVQAFRSVPVCGHPEAGFLEHAHQNGALHAACLADMDMQLHAGVRKDRKPGVGALLPGRGAVCLHDRHAAPYLAVRG